MTAPRDAATPDRSLRRQTIIGSVVLLAGAVVAFGLSGAGLTILAAKFAMALSPSAIGQLVNPERRSGSLALDPHTVLVVAVDFSTPTLNAALVKVKADAQAAQVRPAIEVAVLGIVNTLALSVIERTRELGCCAVGRSRRQVKRMIGVEAVIIAVFGGLLGLLVGSAFGVAIQRALVDQGVTELAFPVVRMAVFVLLAALAGVLAAWLPARRASRLNVLTAIASD